MNPRLRALALAAGAALRVHTILRARHILAQALLLDGDPDTLCPVPWCGCGELDLDGCTSTITYDGVKTCTLGAGHDGMHEHGGWAWTDGLATDLGGVA